jgi:hypothetical protein
VADVAAAGIEFLARQSGIEYPEERRGIVARTLLCYNFIGIRIAHRPGGMDTRGQDQEAGFVLDPDLKVEAPQIREALAFWNRARGDAFAPSRAAFGLRETRAFAPNLQILEICDGGRAYRTRLCGTAIVKQLGHDPTGQLFDSTSLRPVVRRMLQAIAFVREQRRPLRTFAPRTALEGQDFVSHETIFLPLSSDGREIDLIATVGVFRPLKNQTGG